MNDDRASGLTDHPRETPAPAVQRHRGYWVAATATAVGVGIALFAALRPQPSGAVIATAGLIQGDVRVQGPGDDRWRQLDRAAGPIVAGSRVRTTPNGRVALNLPGGASLRIDAVTEITVGSHREIELLRGTIYIDTGVMTAAEAFLITTAFGTVSDSGTQFELATGEDFLRVRIRDGAVSIEPGTGGAALPASAGEQIRLFAGGEVARDTIRPFDPDWAWVETLADPPGVDGRPLLSFLDWVARETGRVLRFDAPATESRARTVVLRGSAVNLSPIEALDVMLSMTDFEYRIRSDGAIVISPRVRGRAP